MRLNTTMPVWEMWIMFPCAAVLIGLALICIFRPEWTTKPSRELTDAEKSEKRSMGKGMLLTIIVLLLWGRIYFS
jgi:hypothetical protein